MDFSIAKHIIKACKSLGRLSKNYKPCNWTVQTMYYAEENIPRLAVRLFNILFYCLRQRTVARFVSLDNLPAIFINNNEVIVFVNNFHSIITYSYRRQPG